MTTRTARCIEVRSDDDDDFDDLVGAIGKLHLDPKSKSSDVNWFDGGDFVGFAKKRVVEKDGIVKVYTEFGNVFKFELISKVS